MTRKQRVTQDSEQPPISVPGSTGMQIGDLSQIIQQAQQIAQSISSEDKDKINKMDMDQMFEHVSKTVFSNLEKGGKQIDPASKQQMKFMSKAMIEQVMESIGQPGGNNEESKIDIGDIPEQKNLKTSEKIDKEEDGNKVPNKESEFEELNSDEEADELQPIVEDLFYNLPVSLEEIYSGKVKKLAVTRERISNKKIVKEKRKLEIMVVPGMRDGQEIRFNREGNEKFGYESGDIVVTLAVNADSNYERIENNIFCTKHISLYESYAAGKGDINVVIRHLDGSYMILKTDGSPLHTRDGTRKVRCGGMPIYDKKLKRVTSYGDLYIRFNLILPETFEGSESLAIIEKMFPTLPNNKDSLIYKNGKVGGFEPGGSKVREVLLEEVTPEDLDQLDYDEQSSSSGSNSKSGSDMSESGSE